MELDYFQLVDRIEHVNEAEGRIEACGEVPAADKSKIFEGHFPDYPIFPGVLLIEAMTQTAGFMVLIKQGYEKLPFLIRVDKAKLRTFVLPGETLNMVGELIHEGSGYAVAHGEVFRDGKSIAQADLRFGIMPWPTDTLRGRVCERAEEVGLVVPVS